MFQSEVFPGLVMTAMDIGLVVRRILKQIGIHYHVMEPQGFCICVKITLLGRVLAGMGMIKG